MTGAEPYDLSNCSGFMAHNLKFHDCPDEVEGNWQNSVVVYAVFIWLSDRLNCLIRQNVAHDIEATQTNLGLNHSAKYFTIICILCL